MRSVKVLLGRKAAEFAAQENVVESRQNYGPLAFLASDKSVRERKRGREQKKEKDGETGGTAR